MFEVPEFYDKFVLFPLFLYLFVSYNGFEVVYNSVLYCFNMKRLGSGSSGSGDTLLNERYKSDKERYIEKRNTEYLTMFDDDPKGEYYNTSIDPVFYLRTELKELLADTDSYIEKEWRTRVLIENTPYGMVIMYYDVYKAGFAYYSNQTGIPYDIMNAVVMKYVRMFRCRDFFIDEAVNPDGYVSPFLRILKMDDAEEKRKKRDAAATLNRGTKIGVGGDMPFVRFKGYSEKTAKEKEKENEKCVSFINECKESTNLKIVANPNGGNIYKNKIIFLGKTANYNFLIPVNGKRINERGVSIKPKGCFSNDLFNKLFSESDTTTNPKSGKEIDGGDKNTGLELVADSKSGGCDESAECVADDGENDTEEYKNSYAYYKKLRQQK